MSENDLTSMSAAFIERVRGVVADRLQRAGPAFGGGLDTRHLLPGKMLRSRLAARLMAADAVDAAVQTVEQACAATELVHTASLCHDDVIDNAVMRRARPTLWRLTGPSGAVLIGDVLLCEAMDLLLRIESGRYVSSFVAKVREVCLAEAEQEVCWRGRQPDAPTCLRLARGKTGPLFAFVGHVCGGDDADLSAALEEAGYRLGAAYQLADDLLDVVGEEQAAGKTLGSDAKRGKFTLPQISPDGRTAAADHVTALSQSALKRAASWPRAHRGLIEFLNEDLRPYFERHLRIGRREMRCAL